MTIHLLSWNLGGNRKDPLLGKKALDIGCRHLGRVLAGGEQFVAAFQECPESEELLRARLPSGVHVFRATPSRQGTHPQVLIASMPLLDRDEWDRTLVAQVDCGGRRLVVGAYHGRDKLSSRDPTARGGAASELRWCLDAYCKLEDTIVLGDFNAASHDTEVQHPWCFGFPSTAAGTTQSHRRERQVLRVVPPRGRTKSFRLREPRREPLWLLIDFIVASESVAKRVRYEHRTVLASEPLTNGRGVPKISDHLPVVGTLVPPPTP